MPKKQLQLQLQQPVPKKQNKPNNKPNTAHASDLIDEAPKPWRTDKRPKGLHIIQKGISKKTATAVWNFFHTQDFPWIQRFGKQYPKTAHYNNWRCGAYVTPAEGEQWFREYPAVHEMAHEAAAAMGEYLKELEPDGSFHHFEPQSVNVHLHKPNWGLGAHYDDSHDVGKGIVLMVSIGNENTFDKETRQPRTFRFTDPVLGRQFDVDTPCRQVLCFKDETYDYWRHESIRNPKQTGECLSFTIRMKDCDGYLNFADDRAYAKGAPAAAKMAHKRLRAKLGPDRVAKLIAKSRVAQQEAEAKKAERAAKRAKAKAKAAAA
tara:strand:+ start:49 stop:1008 length:960 start_codon:yes stop_codon:yes gene_type:complete